MSIKSLLNSNTGLECKRPDLVTFSVLLVDTSPRLILMEGIQTTANTIRVGGQQCYTNVHIQL